MALANVGVLMALAGKRVLLIDWDLEAPGLETYFRGAATLVGDPTVVPGVVDLLERHVASEPLHWSECLLHAEFLQVQLDIISAGRRSADYRSRVQKLDWESMYREHRIGNYVNSLREEWRQAYDFVLIDSRTGFTDIGDICTVLLPDAIVLMFVTSYQNVEGIKAAMSRAVAARKKLPVNRNRLHGIPLPARDEVNTEYEKSLEWRGIYARELGYLYEEWLPKEVSPTDALHKLFIPYVTNWSFGERIPVLEGPRETQDPTSIGAAYKRLTNLLVTGLDWYSLETAASVEDLQATQIELQRERARSAKLEEQRARMWRVTVLAVVLALVIVIAIFIREKPAKPKQAAAAAVSTDLSEGRSLLTDGKPEEALKIFEAHRELVKVRLASHPTADSERDLLDEYDQANHLTGDALVMIGRTNDALTAYEISLDTRSELAKRKYDRSSQLQLAARHRTVGIVRQTQGDLAAALVSYRESETILRRLSVDDRLELELARLHTNVGSIQDDQGKLEEALRSYLDAKEILKHLIAADPVDYNLQTEIAVVHNHIGFVLRQQGKMDEALAAFRADKDVIETLLRHEPKNRRWLHDLWVSNATMAEVLRDHGNLAEAESTSKAANKIADQIAQSYPSVASYQSEHALRYVRWGALLQDQGKLDEAVSAFRSGETILRKLLARDPVNANWKFSLAEAVGRLGEVSTRLGRFDDAENALKEARAITAAIAAKDTTNLDALSALSFQYKALGKLEIKRSRAGAAIQALGTSEDMAIQLIQAGPTSAYWRRHLIEVARLRSEALLMSGEVAAATLALKLAQEARERATVYKGSEDYWQPETARLDIQTGDVLVMEKKTAEARNAFGRAENTLQKLMALDPTNAEWKIDLEKAQQRLASMRAPSL